MADPLTLIILSPSLVAIIVVVYWLKSRNYPKTKVTSTIVRKRSESFDVGPIGNEQMLGQMGNIYYFPVEFRCFELANGDTVNVSRGEYAEHEVGDEYPYKKRVKKL